MANPFLQLMFNAANSLNQPPPVRRNEYEMYQPTYENQNRFAALLDTFPQPEKPSIWRRLGAGLAGFNAQDPYGAAQEMAHPQYFNSLREFKMKAPIMQQAADNERQMNQVGMNANNQMRQFQINEEKNRIAQNKIDSTERTNAEKNEIARIRAMAYDFKSRNPNLKIEAPPGGFLIGIDPTTGETVPILDDQGQRIPSGKMSREDELILMGKNQMNVVNAQQVGANARNAATIAAANARNDADNIAAGERNAATVAGANQRAANRTTTGTSPTAQRTAIANRAQQVINANPTLAQYVTPQGVVAAAKSGGVFSRGTPYDDAMRTKIVDFIEGRSTEIPKLTTGNVTPIRNTPGMPSLPQGSTVEARISGAAPTGKILVIAPNGQQGYIPVGQVEAALAQGYKRAQ